MAPDDGISVPHSGQFALLEAALPDRAREAAGVLLYDPDAHELGARLRRDWRLIADSDDAEIFDALASDLAGKIEELGAESFLEYLETTLSNVLRLSERRPVRIDSFRATLNRLYREHVPATVIEFQTHLPLYSLRAAAGRFGGQQQVEPQGWIETPPGLRLGAGMFVARVVGSSMEPWIPDGSLCVFRGPVVGSRTEKRLLVEDLGESAEGGERYTVKRYRSRKREQAGETWEHESVFFEPLNRDFEKWPIRPGHQCHVLAEFVQVLE